MFAVIYNFKVKPELDPEFQKLWHEGTLFIRQERNSLGSRFHKVSDGQFVAYALWPSREMWKNPAPSSPKLKETLAKMNSCLSETEVIFELEVTDDLLIYE